METFCQGIVSVNITLQNAPAQPSTSKVGWHCKHLKNREANRLLIVRNCDEPGTSAASKDVKAKSTHGKSDFEWAGP